MPMLSKGPDPVMGIFDGFDPKAVYQMIPLNGVRTNFKIVSAGEPEAAVRRTGWN